MTRKTEAEAEKTRAAIMDAAVRLFSHKGYECTTLSDVAAAAGVTRGAVYWHFTNKSDLLGVLFETYAQDVKCLELLTRGADRSQPDPLGCLREWLAAHGRDDCVHFFSSAIYAIVSRLTRERGDADLCRRVDEIARRHEQLLDDVLANCVRRGQLPPNLDLRLAVDAISAFMIGYIEMLRTRRADRLVANFPRLVDSFLPQLAQLTALV